MISRIKGKVVEVRDISILLESGEFTYEVYVPPTVLSCIESGNGDIQLYTYHYYQQDPSKTVPTLIGFSNEIEREFFEKFISVSGVGPKAACKALALPFSTIADAIDSGEISVLKSLPGIGEQRAKEIIAKLQGKVGKFGLMKDKKSLKRAEIKSGIIDEALSVLMQLQYKKKEAENMLEEAVKRNSKIKSSEELLNEVYKQKKVE